MQQENYLNLFIEESRENLQKLEDRLMELEKRSDDTEILNDIFRIAHTFKGMSKSMGFNDIGDLTHNMENILDDLRQGKLRACEKIINMLFNCSDKLQGLIDKIIAGTYQDKTNDIDDLIKNIQDLNKQVLLEPQEEEKTTTEKICFNDFEISLISSAREKGLVPVEVSIKLMEECILPGPRAYMAVKALEECGELIKTHPDVEDIESGNFKQEFRLCILTPRTKDELTAVLKGVSEIDRIEINEIKDKDIDAGQEQQEEPENQTNPENIEGPPEKTESSKSTNQTIRVNLGKLNTLMNLVGELVINRTRLAQLSSEHRLNDLSSVIDTMGGITTDIQEVVMGLRMVPIDQVFSRFPRLVRDISKKLNKDIDLKIFGKDTEIDKIVIEEIGDPLIHLIRNSLDHGIEPPDERTEKGKPPKGIIELTAFNEGDNILIRVSDDGKGIDAEKIRAIAIKKELITPEDAKKLTEAEALDMIFMPGFTTAEQTTDISGRGVGMDVVKSKVASLGGNIKIVSRIGEGTDITICLPSTMAIIQSLLIKAGHEIYALPLNNVSEVIEITQDHVNIIQNKEVITLREEILPVIKLKEVLDVADCGECGDETTTVVVVKTQDKHVGLVVSELIGQQEVVIKPVSKKLCSEDLISGATTLGNGEIAFILNVNGLI